MFLQIILFIINILGIILFGDSALNKLGVLSRTFLDKLIFGVLVLSSALSLVYCFSPIDIGFLATIISIISLLINYKKISLLINDLKRIDVSFILFYILFLYIYFSPSYINILKIIDHGGILLSHIDFFNHASTIEQLKLQPIIHNTQILLFEVRIPFYHYGIYIYPALLARLFDVSGISVALWIIFPFGALILCKYLYEFVGKSIKCSGLIASLICLLVLIISDTSRSILFNNALFDVPYIISASPGAIYGAGIFLFYLKNTIADRNFNYYLFFTISFLLLGFRALYLPIFILYCFFVWALKINKFILKYIIFLILILISMLVIIGNKNSLEFSKFMHTFQGESLSLGLKSTFPILVNLEIIFTVFGGWLISLTIVSILLIIYFWISKKIFNPYINNFFFLVFSYFITLLINFPSPNGDITEFIQRPFLLINIVSSAILICYIYCNVLSNIFNKYKLLVLAPVTAFLFLNNRPFGFPVDHPWHINSYKINIDYSIIEVSTFLKKFKSKAVYVYLPINRESYSQYPEALITGISAMPAFLSRLGFFMDPIMGTKYYEIINAKLHLIKPIITCDPTIKSFKTPVDLYVVSESEIQCLSLVYSAKKHFVYFLPRQK